MAVTGKEIDGNIGFPSGFSFVVFDRNRLWVEYYRKQAFFFDGKA